MTESEQYWTVFEIESDDGMTIVRLRQDLAPSPERNIRIRIIWEMDDRDATTDQWLVAMDELDALLDGSFEMSSGATLSHVLTSTELRQWVFYANSLTTFGEALNSQLPHDPPFPIQVESESDPTWEEYVVMVDIMNRSDT